MKTKSFLLLVVLLSSFLMTNCKRDKPGDQPELPPQAAFVMDMSTYGSAKDTSLKTSVSYRNWGTAFIEVGIWNILLTIGLAVPVASYSAAINTTPTYIGDGVWEWNYTYSDTVFKDTYTSSLKGEVKDGEVKWSMYISKAGGFQNFLWYTGVCDFDHTKGYWILNESPWLPGQLLRIDWNNNGTGIYDIKYTNVKVGASENGGYIHYGITSNTPFNAYYEIFNKGANNTSTIEWNTTTKEGHITDPAVFGNTSYYCWNTLLRDTTCN